MMERNEADSGKKLEPAFAPEWLKTTPSDDHGAASTPRNARNLASYRRSHTTNESHLHGKISQEREKLSNLDNIVNDVLEKDTLRRSNSMISGRGNQARAKKPGIEAVSTTSSRNGIIKASFEREFPHLGAEDSNNRQGLPEVVKVQSGPFYSSAVVGGDSWNSVLAEMPEPFRTRVLKESDDSLKLEELEVKMSRQLIPKTSVNFADKVKSKGSRVVDLSMKVGQQPQAQSGVHNFRGLNRLDTPKTPQIGNFQVLNREKNGDAAILVGGQRPTSVINAPIKSPRPIKPNGKSTSLPAVTFGDKRPVSQQNRSDFFNSLRKKTSESAQFTALEKSKPSVSDQPKEKDSGVVDSGSESASGSVMSDGHESSSPSWQEKSWFFDPAEEERLLRLLGWKEDAGEEEEGLTAAEIDAFIIEYEKRRPTSEYLHRSLLVAKSMLTEMGGDGC